MTDDANTIITPPPPPVADEERESSSSSSFAGRSDDSDDDRDEEEEEKDEKKKSKRIAVYLRLKPSHDHLSKRVRVEEREGGDDEKKKMVSFDCEEDEQEDEEKENASAAAASKKYAKRGSQMFTFFDEILDENASQEDTFDVCARNVVLNCLDGVNGTIFAYGQTGSGKTHTITGGNDGAFENRGIIPRSLETVFREMEKRKRKEEEKNGNKVVTFDATCEYVEVYNEQAYDLLGRHDLNMSSMFSRGGVEECSRDGNNNDDDDVNAKDDDMNEAEMFQVSREIGNNRIDLEPSSSRNQQQQQHQLHLPRVYLQEDEKKTFHLKGISTHRICSEEEAMDLLFAGDANRAVAETPLNLASSRSHCVFTITIEKRTSGDDTLQRAKLNIVDLAGSERVSKTKIDGSVLTEAKHINLSLHYLERVIVALQEQ